MKPVVKKKIIYSSRGGSHHMGEINFHDNKTHIFYFIMMLVLIMTLIVTSL